MSETGDHISAEERDYQEIRDALLDAAANGEFEVLVAKESIGRKVIVNGEGDPDMPISVIGSLDVDKGRVYIDNLWGSGYVDVPPSILWLATPVVEKINEVRDLQIDRATSEFMNDLGDQITPN